jgi:hypothetical protein
MRTDKQDDTYHVSIVGSEKNEATASSSFRSKIGIDRPIR